MSVTILLADDHPIVRRGLKSLLESEIDFHVVAEADDGIEALELIDQHKPDILVVDMLMPGMNGLEVMRQAKKRWPRLQMIMLSMQSADAYVVGAFNNGASGYVLKDTGPSEIIQAVRVVLNGERYLSPKLSERLLNIDTKKESTLSDPLESLTNREREILQMAAEGLSSAQIAQKLFISPRTVELHRGRMMKKLGLHNQTDLLRYAIHTGIVPINN